RCAVCDARGALLCRPCRRALPWVRGPVCPRCGDPDPRGRIRCPLCTRLGRSIGTARSALRLEAGGAAVVGAWKDAARAPVADVAAACLLGCVPRPGADLLVPVPAARGRAAWRGVDWQLSLARLLGSAWGIPVRTDALVRIHEAPQRGRSAPERRRNAMAAFVERGTVHGRVVLVDDVLTTGATARAAALRLRRAGAEQVDLVTLARVATIV
ncbi:MAG: ComF family protein, partial [Gaiellales bacterium]